MKCHNIYYIIWDYVMSSALLLDELASYLVLQCLWKCQLEYCIETSRPLWQMKTENDFSNLLIYWKFNLMIMFVFSKQYRVHFVIAWRLAGNLMITIAAWPIAQRNLTLKIMHVVALILIHGYMQLGHVWRMNIEYQPFLKIWAWYKLHIQLQ